MDLDDKGPFNILEAQVCNQTNTISLQQFFLIG